MLKFSLPYIYIKKLFFFCSLTVILFAVPSQKILAEDESPSPTPGLSSGSNSSLFSQIGKEITVPIWTNGNRILGGSLLAAGMVYSNKGKRRYDKQETFKEAKPLGNFGYIGETLGWGYMNGLYMLAHGYNGFFNQDVDSMQATEHMFKASTYTLIMVTALKLVIKERRPGYPEDKTSFPSGHAAMSFAFASVVASRHGWAYGSAAYLTALYISVSRINDDWHYLHDVLVGMGIGASYGWGLSYAYDNHEIPYHFTVLPLPHGGGMASWDTTF